INRISGGATRIARCTAQGRRSVDHGPCRNRRDGNQRDAHGRSVLDAHEHARAPATGVKTVSRVVSSPVERTQAREGYVVRVWTYTVRDGYRTIGHLMLGVVRGASVVRVDLV